MPQDLRYEPRGDATQPVKTNTRSRKMKKGINQTSTSVLINFNIPTHLKYRLDQLCYFKGVSRTSVLVISAWNKYGQKLLNSDVFDKFPND